MTRASAPITHSPLALLSLRTNGAGGSGEHRTREVRLAQPDHRRHIHLDSIHQRTRRDGGARGHCWPAPVRQPVGRDLPGLPTQAEETTMSDNLRVTTLRITHTEDASLPVKEELVALCMSMLD